MNKKNDQRQNRELAQLHYNKERASNHFKFEIINVIYNLN